MKSRCHLKGIKKAMQVNGQRRGETRDENWLNIECLIFSVFLEHNFGEQENCSV